MSGICVVAILAVVVGRVAMAEMMPNRGDSSQFQAFKNLKSKLASMEDYSAVYVWPDRSREVMKPFPEYHRDKSSMPLTVIMRPNLKRQKSIMWLAHHKRKWAHRKVKVKAKGKRSWRTLFRGRLARK